MQETWLRLTRSDAAAVDNLGGWLTTVVSRVCLDLLRRAYDAARGPTRGARGRGRRRARRPRARGRARRRGGDGAAGRARDAVAGRAAGVRAARPLRAAVRRGRRDHGPLPGRGAPARQPRPAPGAGPRRARRRPTGRPSAGWSRRSSRPRGAGTSRRSSTCSTRARSSAPTRVAVRMGSAAVVAGAAAVAENFVGPGPGRAAHPARRVRRRRWSTGGGPKVVFGFTVERRPDHRDRADRRPGRPRPSRPGVALRPGSTFPVPRDLSGDSGTVRQYTGSSPCSPVSRETRAPPPRPRTPAPRLRQGGDAIRREDHRAEQNSYPQAYVDASRAAVRTHLDAWEALGLSPRPAPASSPAT